MALTALQEKQHKVRQFIRQVIKILWQLPTVETRQNSIQQFTMHKVEFSLTPKGPSIVASKS